MFIKQQLYLPPDLFTKLFEATLFEDVAFGRKGAVLVEPEGLNIPIVRTTTHYTQPAQKFVRVHKKVLSAIQKEYSPFQANNALIELYGPSYRRMGYHSDQALDLATDSYIGVFSCYNQVNPTDLRMLRIKHKTTHATVEIVLEPNSVIIFSTETNRHHLHQIVPVNPIANQLESTQWLGITFRLSKTWIQFVGSKPYFTDHIDRPLRLANSDEKKEFLTHRSAENKSIDFAYPFIEYTLSPSDIMVPI